jgi:hypothetical protein
MLSRRWLAALCTGAALFSGPNLAQTTFSNGDFQNYVLRDVDGVAGLDNRLMVATNRDGSAFFTGTKTNVFNSAPWYEWSSWDKTASNDEILVRDNATGNQYVSVGSLNGSDVSAIFTVLPEGTGVYRISLRMAGDGFVTIFNDSGRIPQLRVVNDPSGVSTMVERNNYQPSHSTVVNGTPGVWNEVSVDVYLTPGETYHLYFTNYWSARSDLTSGVGGVPSQDSAAFFLDDVSVVKQTAVAQAPDTVGGP